MPSLRIRIPKDRQTGFVRLLELNDDGFDELMTVLDRTPLIYRTDKMISTLIADLKIISQDIATEIIKSVFPLYSIQSESELPINAFVEEICKIIERTPSINIDLSGSNRDELNKRLTKLLSVQSANIASKAKSLMFEHNHIFQSARIFTDVRPVFGQDITEAPVAYVIVHMVRIRYFEDGQIKEFFAALDTNDVQKLNDVTERAKLKVKSLKSAMQDADLPYVDEE